MKYIVIHREDYNGHKDSEGIEYFDYVLSALGISEHRWSEIGTIELKVKDDAFDTIRYED